MQLIKNGKKIAAFVPRHSKCAMLASEFRSEDEACKCQDCDVRFGSEHCEQSLGRQNGVWQCSTSSPLRSQSRQGGLSQHMLSRLAWPEGRWAAILLTASIGGSVEDSHHDSRSSELGWSQALRQQQMTWCKRWTCTVPWRSLRTARTKTGPEQDTGFYISLRVASSIRLQQETNPVSNNNLADVMGVLRPDPSSNDSQHVSETSKSCCFRGYVHQEVIVEHVAGDPERTSRSRVLPSQSRLGWRWRQEVRH